MYRYITPTNLCVFYSPQLRIYRKINSPLRPLVSPAEITWGIQLNFLSTLNTWAIYLNCFVHIEPLGDSFGTYVSTQIPCTIHIHYTVINATLAPLQSSHSTWRVDHHLSTLLHTKGISMDYGSYRIPSALVITHRTDGIHYYQMGIDLYCMRTPWVKMLIGESRWVPWVLYSFGTVPGIVTTCEGIKNKLKHDLMLDHQTNRWRYLYV